MNRTPYRPFLALLNSYRVTTLSLARVTGVPIETIQDVVWEIAEVDPATAEQIVTGFNQMTGGSFTTEQLGLQVVVEGELV